MKAVYTFAQYEAFSGATSLVIESATDRLDAYNKIMKGEGTGYIFEDGVAIQQIICGHTGLVARDGILTNCMTGEVMSLSNRS